MNYKRILYVLGTVLALTGIFMLLPLVVGLLYHEYYPTLMLALSAFICSPLGCRGYHHLYPPEEGHGKSRGGRQCRRSAVPW